MTEPNPVADEEVLLRHIPGGTLWQAPGPRITSANFQLRRDRGETGVSVTRLKITAPERLLELVRANPGSGSRVASARAADIRALGLEVVPVPLPQDAGHAEIRSAVADLDEHLTRKKLANLFDFLSQDLSASAGPSES